MVNDERWNSDSFFREYLINYTNAPTILREDFTDAEDGDGVFSGLLEYRKGIPEWAYDGFVGRYATDSWQYTRQGEEPGEPRGGEELGVSRRR